MHPYFAITGLCPWLPGGPPLEHQPEWISPLAQTGALVAARWLGRVEDLESNNTMSFSERVLIGWLRPGAGLGRFALIVQESGGAIPVGDIQGWLSAVTAPGEWLSFHSQGPHALAGRQGWRLGAPSDPRRIERLGGALELSAAAEGDDVDWTRLPGASASASSFEDGFEPANLIKGLLWPAPFSPRIWLGKEAATDGGQWVEVDLGAFRPVTRLVLAWPAVAGWSAPFQPRRVTIKASFDRRSGLEKVETIAAAEGFVFEHRFADPTLVRRVRVELGEPSGMPLDRRARLAALQAWGPWDGQAKFR